MPLGDMIVNVKRDGTLWHENDNEPYIKMTYDEWSDWLDTQRKADTWSAFIEEEFRKHAL